MERGGKERQERTGLLVEVVCAAKGEVSEVKGGGRRGGVHDLNDELLGEEDAENEEHSKEPLRAEREGCVRGRVGGVVADEGEERDPVACGGG